MNRGWKLAVTVLVLTAPAAVAQQPVPEFLARVQELAPLGLPPSAAFGSSIDAGGGVLVVGAPFAEGAVPGSFDGAALVFERDPSGTWIEVQRLLGPDWSAQFGYDVAVDDGRIVVGSLHTGAWVFDRQPSGAWIEVTWLGVLPSPGGTKVEVEDEVVICRRNPVLYQFQGGQPGFDVWEEQPNGTWQLVPVTNPSAGGPTATLAQDFGVHNGVIIEQYSRTNFNCAHPGTYLSGTATYVRDATGWRGDAAQHEFGEWYSAGFSFEEGLFAFGRFGAVSFCCTFPCPYGGNACGECYWPWPAIVNKGGLPSTWVGSSYFSAWPPSDADYAYEIDIQDGRLVAAQQRGSAMHVCTQTIDPSVATSPTVSAVQVAIDPTFVAPSSSSVEFTKVEIAVDAQHTFVTRLDQGSGVVYVLGQAQFAASGPTARLGTGEDVGLSLDVGPTFAGRPYMILGSATGTFPGVPLDHGVIIPLVVDGYTNYTLQGAPHLVGQVGNFDAKGRANATIDVPTGLGTALAGVTLNHAFVWLDGSILALRASNAVSTILVP